MINVKFWVYIYFNLRIYIPILSIQKQKSFFDTPIKPNWLLKYLWYLEL